MGTTWKVEMNSGARASLVADGVRKQIWRPQTMSRREFYRLLPEGMLIDEAGLRAMFLIWE
jgi:hypothetical protein